VVLQALPEGALWQKRGQDEEAPSQPQGLQILRLISSSRLHSQGDCTASP